MKTFSSPEIKEFVSNPHHDENVILNKDPSWPKISIVTVSYNQGRFIERTILSILNQNYPNLEYIIMDGGSSDNSVEIIKKYKCYLDFVSIGPDGGPPNALNVGFSHSKGEIYGCLNSDDFLLPGALMKVARAFTDHIGADVVYGNGYVVDSEDKLKTPIYSTPWGLKRYAYGVANVIQQSCFYRRRVFEKTRGFNMDNKTCWDGELLVDMAVAGGRFVRMKDFLAAFRIHEQSISGSGRLQAEYMKDCRRLFRKIMKREQCVVDTLFWMPVWRVIKYLLVPDIIMRKIWSRWYYSRV